jgi:hypothetical protein
VLLLDSNTARHGALSTGVFCRKQATILFTSGICAPHSRNTSGVQAICCSMVPRYSCGKTEVPLAARIAIETTKLRITRCSRMPDIPSIDMLFNRVNRLKATNQSNEAERWFSSNNKM